MPTSGRNPGTYSQAVRLLKMLDELRARSRGALLCELAHEFEVTERQVRRDLTAIEQAGFNLRFELDDRRTRVALDEGRGGTFRLSLRRRYTLLAARRVFDVLDDTPFREDIRAIYGEIVASLPPEDGRVMEIIGDRFLYLPSWGAKKYERHGDVIDGLLTGVLRRLRVSCTYRAANGRGFKGVLEPYAMVLYKQGLYVLGSALRSVKGGTERVERQGVRVYAVERFSRAEHLHRTTFELPAGFGVERYFDGVFGIFSGGEPSHVVIDFLGAGRDLVESRRWHPSQRLIRRRDGSVRLEMDVVNTTEVVPWVMGWGPLARVRAPADLVSRVADEHRRALGRYEAD